MIPLTTTSVITFNATPSPDFDGDGTVGFSDFIAFASKFGTRRAEAAFDARFDLDGDGETGFSDFIAFASQFGTTVAPPSGATVTPPGAEVANKMYWTEVRTDKIQRSNLDGSGVEDLVTPEWRGLSGIALDVSGGKMYWTDRWPTERIQRSNLDGSGVEDLVTGLNDPIGIALDVAGGKMYWIDRGDTDKIQRSNLDGSGVEDLVTDLVTTDLGWPNGIALDVSGGKMYWTDHFWDKIQRSNLDGSGVENLVTIGSYSTLGGIALDVSGGKMYWTDSATEKIQRSNLDGSGVEDLITGLDWPRGIALDVSGGKMYWTDSGTEKIQRSNLDGSGVEDLVATGFVEPKGIALGFGVPVFATDLVVRAWPWDIITTHVTLEPGERFKLMARVSNQGTEQTAATTLRYYRSSDATISTDDVEVGTAAVSSLSAWDTGAEKLIELIAPSDAGTYYYGACVESVSGESNTDNNCSSGVSVTVSGGGGGASNLGACRVGLVVRPNQRCTVSGGAFINIGGGCYNYTPFGTGRICSGSFNLNGLQGTRAGDDFRITAVP